jgi:hypothetical protein
VRILLNILCSFTAVACLWLGIMFLVLHRPGFEGGLLMSALFLSQTLLTLAVLNGWLPGGVWRALVLAGAAGIVWTGGRAITNTLNGRHFEGFALIIGAALLLQGLLTAGQLITTRFTSSSKVHQFGN